MNSPIRYPGGKGVLSERILQHFPQHYTDLVYVEPFGGGGSVLFAKEPSPIEVYNDIDSRLFALFEVIKDPYLFQQLFMRVNLSLYSRQLFDKSKAKLKLDYDLSCEKDLVDLAYYTYINMRQGYVTMFPAGGWGYDKHKPECISRWLSSLEALPEISNRLSTVQIQCIDALECIKKYDRDNALFYIDPPYYGIDIYAAKFPEEDLENLVDLLIDVKGYVIFSNYRNDICDDLLEFGWKRIDIKWKSVINTSSTPANYDNNRIECLYLNYQESRL